MSEIVRYYDELAKDYDDNRFNNSYGKFIDQQERQILNKLLPNQNQLVVDMACGSGRLLNYANYGVDASQEMVHIAQQKFPDKKVFVSDAETLPFADQSVDTIITFHFLMHLDIEKVQRIMQECHRVLKNNGRLIFDIPSKKRRRLLNYKASNWHGALSLSIDDAYGLSSSFSIKSVHGLMLLPIHRFPKSIRKHLAKFDAFLAKSFLKEYSSYLVIECVKK